MSIERLCKMLSEVSFVIFSCATTIGSVNNLSNLICYTVVK